MTGPGLPNASSPDQPPCSPDAMGYRRSVMLNLDFADAQVSVREALAKQGFGIVSEIDLAATLHTKLGVEIEPQVILGACNPRFALRALEAEPSIGVLLPCNVVIRGVGPQTLVEIQDPDVMSQLTGNVEIANLADEVGVLLDAAMHELGEVTVV